MKTWAIYCGRDGNGQEHTRSDGALNAENLCRFFFLGQGIDKVGGFWIAENVFFISIHFDCL